jgi:hypothetical protein
MATIRGCTNRRTKLAQQFLCQSKLMLGNQTANIPTFTVFTEYVSGVPHLVTVRPAAIPESQVTELSTAVEIAGVLKREVPRVVKLHKPTWAFTTTNARVSIALNTTNLTGGGSQSMDRFTSLGSTTIQYCYIGGLHLWHYPFFHFYRNKGRSRQRKIKAENG